MQSTLQQKEKELSPVWPYSKSYGRTSINAIIGSADAGKSMVGAFPSSPVQIRKKAPNRDALLVAECCCNASWRGMLLQRLEV